MKNTAKVLVVLAAGLVLLLGTGCNKLKARDQLNKGVQAFKNNKFEQAIDHFQQAVTLDPSLINARLYLATAYAQQYVGGVDTPENIRMAEQAIEQYKLVLQADPKNINSVKGIAYLLAARFHLAKVLQRLRKSIPTILSRITPLP
jgi:tetratricopeptide (TPR) repeat protein